MDTSTSQLKLDSLRFLQYSFFLIVLLYFGQPLLVPLSFAFLISFILYPVCKWMEIRKVPRMMAISISLFFFSILLILLVSLLIYQFIQFAKQWPVLYQKVLHYFNELTAKLDEYFGISLEDWQAWLKSFVTSSFESILQWLPGTIYSTSISFVLVLLIPIYVAGILYYRDNLIAFLYRIFSQRWHSYIKVILPEVILAYYNFIKGMAIVYLAVGILNSIGLAIVGVPNPIFFGFVASILTFIPYVGIAVGALLPMTIVWLTYDSIWYPMGIIIIFTIVQVLEANVIFPLAVSFKLKLNVLATIIVIVAGGIIWGASGMILFLPFFAILKLIADKVEELQPIAILLGTHDDLKT